MSNKNVKNICVRAFLIELLNRTERENAKLKFRFFVQKLSKKLKTNFITVIIKNII